MKNCPFCQTPASDSSAFCGNCGKSLTPAQAAPSATVSPYAPPTQPAAASPYAPPTQPAAAPPYAPPSQPEAASPYAPSSQPEAASPYAPPSQPAAVSPYAPPSQPIQSTPVYTQPAQPVYQPATQTGEWNAPVVDMPKKFPLPRFLGIGAAVLVLAGMATAAVLLLTATPETKVEKAMSKTQNAVESQLNAISKEMGGDILSQMEEKPSLVEFEMDLSETIPYLPSGQWIRLKNYTDPEADLANMQIENSFDVNVDLFSDSENLTLSAPDLLSYPIAFSYQVLEEKLADGSLTDSFYPSYDDYDYDWNAFPGFGNDSNLFGNATYSDSYEASAAMVPMIGLINSDPTASLFSGLSGLYSGIDFEKYEEKLNEAAEKLEEAAEYKEPKKTTYPGISGQVEIITATYPDDAIDEYIEDCIDVFMDMMDDVGSNFTGGTPVRIPSVSASDFTKTVVIQSGYVCAYEAEIRLKVEGESANFTLTIQTEDGKNPLNDWSAELIGRSGYSTIEISISGSGDFSAENGLDYTIKGSASEGSGTPISATMNIQYDPKSSDDNITVSIRENSGMRFSVTGTLETEDNAVSFTLNKISYDGGYMGSGSYKVDAVLRAEITKGYQGKTVPSGARDGFDLTAREWEEIMENAMDKIYARIGSDYYW